MSASNQKQQKLNYPVIKKGKRVLAVKKNLYQMKKAKVNFFPDGSRLATNELVTSEPRRVETWPQYVPWCDALEDQKKLQQWDMETKYGPCLSITRQDRWKRAEADGLAPPKDVWALLEKELIPSYSLWEKRVTH